MSRSLLQQIIWAILVMLLLAGCGTPAATPEPSTPTPELPTPTPGVPTMSPAITPSTSAPTSGPASACGLEVVASCTDACVGSKQPSLEIKITCESGKFTQSVNTSQHYNAEGEVITEFTGTRIYADTGNEYKVVGNTSFAYTQVGFIGGRYHVEVTGGVFGDTPQISDSDWTNH